MNARLENRQAARRAIDLLIEEERLRQIEKWGHPRRLPPLYWLGMLAEEMGELAKAIIEGDGEAMASKLIQVAALAHAWIEEIMGAESENAAAI